MATLNQKRVAKNVLEKVREGKKISIGQEMRKVGYARSTSNMPEEKLLKTKGWNELMKKYLPDELLAQVHKGLLEHKDWRARDAGLDKGYKIKRRYAPVEVNLDITKIQKLETLQKKLSKAISEIERE